MLGAISCVEGMVLPMSCCNANFSFNSLITEQPKAHTPAAKSLGSGVSFSIDLLRHLAYYSAVDVLEIQHICLQSHYNKYR